MAIKRFHLLGEDPSTAQDIELPSSLDYQSLQHLVASHFAIVDPNGIGFVTQSEALMTVTDVVAVEDDVAITVDGKAVHEVPGPKGLPFIGNYFEVYPDHLGNHQRLFEKYGPIFKTTNMGSTVYHTNDPALASIVFGETDFFSKRIIEGHPLYPIKNQESGVFLGDTNTPEWKEVHKFLPPALGPKAVRHYAPTMQQTVEDAFKVFDELDERDEAWNVYPYMLKLGSQAVGKLVLGMDFQHFSSVDSRPHEMVLRIAQSLELNKKITAMGGWYRNLPFGDPQRLREARARIETMMEESVANASKGVEDLDLQNAALQAENMVDYVLRASDSKGNKLPRHRIMEPLVVATGAGFTTTSSLLSWLIYGLVVYPGMQERILQELIDNGFEQDTQITSDLTNKLTFLDKYIKETQRRHNPSYQPARTAAVDMILPGGYKIPQDAIVIPALHHIHNNTRIWDNPTLFDPDRWDTERVKNRPNASYIPFATGPRMCVGFNFALQEVKVFLPKLVYRYKFSLAQDGPVDYDPMFQLIRPNNLYVRAERRLKWPPRSE
ncbi:cytochrome P450 monooxygenase [Ilyonectria robusta]|uniref:cytochrome P450 monooxygenase n=1 Tax=Ilyonectria robusta TaxID=1079257 RepID=UPI001E8EEBE4|nr:cytochrome P450 monooxygenase [Ilyonectria robusta]KAH8656846.1 cytochrome P450 monooxygenase [Ilyonectria robusta]